MNIRLFSISNLIGRRLEHRRRLVGAERNVGVTPDVITVLLTWSYTSNLLKSCTLGDLKAIISDRIDKKSYCIIEHKFT